MLKQHVHEYRYQKGSYVGSKLESVHDHKIGAMSCTFSLPLYWPVSFPFNNLDLWVYVVITIFIVLKNSLYFIMCLMHLVLFFCTIFRYAYRCVPKKEHIRHYNSMKSSIVPVYLVVNWLDGNSNRGTLQMCNSKCDINHSNQGVYLYTLWWISGSPAWICIVSHRKTS